MTAFIITKTITFPVKNFEALYASTDSNEEKTWTLVMNGQVLNSVKVDKEDAQNIINQLAEIRL